jgi:predicted ATP-dependent endonuclease of OLD family
MLRARPQGASPRQMAVNISRSLSDSVRRTVVVDMLRAADVGLRDVLVLGPNDDEALVEFARNTELSKTEQDRTRRLAGREERIQFLHHGAISDVMLDIYDESSGTLRLLELATRAISVLERGGLFLVDEIDASLHPLLTASLVRLFRSAHVNRTHAQLVFTSHDATLLGNLDGEEVLARDQVWFTEKDEDGTSELFPLAEFKPRRQGENRTRRYLNGNYGAIPELSMHLFENAIASRIEFDA